MRFRKSTSTKIIGAVSSVAFCVAISSFALGKISAAPQEMTSFVLVGASLSDRESRDKFGRTPLMHAAKNCDIEAVRALVESGADVAETDKTGFTVVDVLTETINRLTAIQPENMAAFAAKFCKADFLKKMHASLQGWQMELHVACQRNRRKLKQ